MRSFSSFTLAWIPASASSAFGAFAQEHDARNDIVVVDDFAVFAMDGSGELAQPDLRALRHDGDILHPQRSAALGREDSVFDVAARF